MKRFNEIQIKQNPNPYTKFTEEKLEYARITKHRMLSTLFY